MKKVLLTSACLIGLYAPAIAADVVPVEAVPLDWTGFHIGIGGGWQAITHDASADLDFDIAIGEQSLIGGPIPIFSAERNLGDDGGFFTVEAGLDFQPEGSNFVLGIFGNFDWFDNTDASTKFCLLDCSDLEIATFKTRHELSDLWTIGGRVGWLANEQTLLYVLAGYSQAQIDGHADLAVPLIGETFGLANDGSSVDGLTVGGGIEVLATENVSIKLEGRYTDLSDFDAHRDHRIPIGGPVDIVLGNDIDVDTSITSVRGVISYRFNWWQ